MADRVRSPLMAVCLLWAAASAAGAAPDGAPEPPPEAPDMHAPPPAATTLDSSVVIVPIDLGSGRPVVDLLLNGRGPYRFILDTGAGGTVIDRELAAELSLPVIGQTRMGDPRSPNALAAGLVQCDSLRMGGLLLERVTMATMEVRKMMGAATGGVLGLPDLGALLVSLDYPQGRLVLTRGSLAPGDPGVVEYQSPDGIVSIPIQVDTLTIAAHLDSGNPGAISLPYELAEKLPLKAPPVEIGRAQTVASTATIWEAQIAGEVQIAGLSYTDPVVHLTDLLVGWANIGYDAMRGLTVTLDQGKRLLKLERTGTGASGPPARRRLGIMLAGRAVGTTTIGEGLDIERIAPGSIAEKSGLLPGDLIVALNGRPVAGLAPGELQEFFGGPDPLKIDVRREGKPMEITIP